MLRAPDIADAPPAARPAVRLGDMHWLTAERACLYAAGAALIWMALVGKAVWLFTGAHNHTGDVFGDPPGDGIGAKDRGDDGD